MLKPDSNGVSMIFRYLLAVCLFFWCTLSYTEFYIMLNLVYPRAATRSSSPAPPPFSVKHSLVMANGW